MKKIIKDKVTMIALIVKGITGVLGASLVLSEEHPYLALTVLAIGAAVNEYLLYINDNK